MTTLTDLTDTQGKVRAYTATVRDFHVLSGQPTGEEKPGPELLRFRAALILEEWVEVQLARGWESEAAVLRELADLLYVVHGAAVTFGMNLFADLRYVHLYLSNSPNRYTLEGAVVRAVDCLAKGRLLGAGHWLTMVDTLVRKEWPDPAELDAMFDAVHTANLSKFGPNGHPYAVRDDGKILKGPHYQPVDPQAVLDNARRAAR